MQASLNKDAYISTTIVVLPNGAQWQNLELKFCRLLQHGAPPAGTEYRMRRLDPQKCSCVRV